MSTLVGLILAVGLLATLNGLAIRSLRASVNRISTLHRSEMKRFTGLLHQIRDGVHSPDLLSGVSSGLGRLTEEMHSQEASLKSQVDRLLQEIRSATREQRDSLSSATTEAETLAGEMQKVAEKLDSAAEKLGRASSDMDALVSDLRITGIGFEKIDTLVVRMTELLPGVGSAVTNLKRIAEEAGGRELFSRTAFLRFEEAMQHLTNSAHDLAAVSRTLVHELDTGGDTQVEVPDDVGHPRGPH